MNTKEKQKGLNNMGNIRNLDIRSVINKYKTQVFFETGTGYGTGVYNALQYPFGLIVSVEIDKEQSDLLTKFFRFDDRVKIFNTLSKDALLNIIPQLPLNISVFFFLDAHFPGADLGKSGFDDEKDESIRMPLYEELNVIKKLRTDKGAKDVILVDDIMLYDDERSYEAGHQKSKTEVLPKEHRNQLNKFIEIFKDSHNPRILTSEQGWLFLEPKE
jgi:hypothetical protein